MTNVREMRHSEWDDAKYEFVVILTLPSAQYLWQWESHHTSAACRLSMTLRMGIDHRPPRSMSGNCFSFRWESAETISLTSSAALGRARIVHTERLDTHTLPANNSFFFRQKGIRQVLVTIMQHNIGRCHRRCQQLKQPGGRNQLHHTENSPHIKKWIPNQSVLCGLPSPMALLV